MPTVVILAERSDALRDSVSVGSDELTNWQYSAVCELELRALSIMISSMTHQIPDHFRDGQLPVTSFLCKECSDTI